MILMINQDATTLPKRCLRASTTSSRRRRSAAARRAFRRTAEQPPTSTRQRPATDDRSNHISAAGSIGNDSLDRRTSVRREHVLVPLAACLVGLHIADDNFLQPQPGTSAADHLVSGLVPLALVAAAALAYPRVRAGARAALALLLGYFGVLVGTEAAYYTLAGGRSGDDYTGLALARGRLPAPRRRHRDALAEPTEERQPRPPLPAAQR